MQSYGRGDAFAADELRPHFYDLYKSGMEIIKPVAPGQQSNDVIIAAIDDIARMVNSHPHVSAYFGIQPNKELRSMLYMGFKQIHNMQLYKNGAPDYTTEGNLTLLRADTQGHAYEQMLYAIVFILYCIAQPRKANNATRYRQWKKLLIDSGSPVYEKNVREKDIASWLQRTDVIFDQTVKLREEWQRGEVAIRLSPLEARMIAFANGDDDVSEEAINRAIQNCQGVGHGTDGYQINLLKREGATTQVTLAQGQATVKMMGNNFEISHDLLEIFEKLPESVIATLKGKPVEEICAIGVFEGLKLKVGRIDQYDEHARFFLPVSKTGQDYVLSKATLDRITG